MASKSNFPSCKKCTEILEYNFNIDNTAPKNLYKDNRNILIRQHAVSVIAKVTKKCIPDAYVPYLAMNYFDRFLFHYDMTDVEGRTDAEKVHLIAISCFTLSSKDRSYIFNVDRFLSHQKTENAEDMDLNWISIDMVTKMQHHIMEKLKRKTKPETAFWFLNHFYSHFIPLGLKRHSINEIIVQAQGVHTFVDFKPTYIALSACVAAATIACPLKELPDDINNIITNNMLGCELNECIEKMTEFCRRINILIEVAAEEIEAEKPNRAKGEGKGKAVKKVEEPQPEMEEAILAIEPMKRLIFELKWDTDVPALEEDTDVPALEEDTGVPPLKEEIKHAQLRESTAISLRIPGTAKNINIGCGTCNIS